MVSWPIYVQFCWGQQFLVKNMQKIRSRDVTWRHMMPMAQIFKIFSEIIFLSNIYIVSKYEANWIDITEIMPKKLLSALPGFTPQNQPYLAAKMMTSQSRMTSQTKKIHWKLRILILWKVTKAKKT